MKRLLVVIMACSVAPCMGASKAAKPAPPIVTAPPAPITVSSPDFQNGQVLNKKMTCFGDNKAPKITWSAGPADTVEYVLICEDPDATGAAPFVHWLVFGIPKTVTSVDTSLEREGKSDNGIKQGTNGFGKIGFDGPCPPAGKPHRYQFTVYATNAKITLLPGASRFDVDLKLKGHIIGQGQIVGTYEKVAPAQ